MVAAGRGEYETGMCSEGWTREHLILAKTMGVQKIIVCVNKMDDRSVAWSQERFEEIKADIGALLKKIGYCTDSHVPYVPISGIFGYNLKVLSDRMPWYTGPTLLQALDQMVLKDSAVQMKQKIEKPLRIPILDVYKIDHKVGTVAVGKI